MSEEDVIGVCTECKSDQPNHALEKDPFLAAGADTSCKYCGGVVVLCYRRDREDVLRQNDSRRNIG